jgi:trimeric autotransporter adhesin
VFVVAKVSGLRPSVRAVWSQLTARLTRCIAFGLALAFLGWHAPSPAESWQYLYDEVGRLKSAIAPSGERADYEYDEVGNIVAIRRVAVGALHISEFTPQIGKGGTSVKILGSGFSTTAANNAVKFNGVNASVTAATANQLTVNAPNTGSTGSITVTVGAVTATSKEHFVYSGSFVSGTPTIGNVTPACAAPGTTVAMTGTNFDIAPGATRVEVGTAVAITAVSSATALSFVVPPASGSYLRVVTAVGISAASTKLFVPPVGNCTEYETPLRPTAGGAALTLSISAAGKKAAVLIMGNANAGLTLHFSSFMPSTPGTQMSYTLYDHMNRSLQTGIVRPEDASIVLPLLPATGTYTVVVTSPSATASAAIRLVSDPTLSTSGSAVTVNVANPGQSVRVAFAGTAGRDWTVETSNIAMTGPGSDPGIRYYVRRAIGKPILDACYLPEGCTRTWVCLSGSSCAYGWDEMEGGTHSLIIKGRNSGDVGTATVKSWSSARIKGTLTVGTEATFASTVPGQVVERTFSGVAGQQMGLAVRDFTGSVNGSALSAIVVRPDGQTHASIGNPFLIGSTLPLGIDIPPLTMAGTHTVRVRPMGGENALASTFTGKVLVTRDYAASLAPSGSGLSVNLGYGQQARLSLANASAGDVLLDLSSLMMSSGGSRVRYDVLRSDGSSVAFNLSCNPGGAGCTRALRDLPAGTYQLVLTPEPVGVSVSLTARAWSSSKVAGTLTIGAFSSFATSVAGQRAEYTFSGTAGDQHDLILSAFSTSVAGSSITAQIKRTDGYPIYTHDFTAADTASPRTLGLPALPATGTYTLSIYPADSGDARQTTTFSGQAKISAAGPAVLATDGSVSNVFMGPQQSRTMSFVGITGKDWTLDISDLSLSTGGQDVRYQIFQSGSTNVGSGQCRPNGLGCSFTWRAMPSGTHSIIFTTGSSISASFSLRSWVSDRVTGSLVAETPLSVATTVPGQIAQYTFSGTAGQQASLSMTSFSTALTGAELRADVIAPSGNPHAGVIFTAAQTSGTPYTFVIPTLPATGTYTVEIYPNGNATTFSGQVLLSRSAVFLTDGTPATVTFSAPGETKELTFNAEYGEEFALRFSQLALNGGSNDTMQYTMVLPWGYVYSPFTCYESGAGCAATWMGLPDGEHKLRLTAQTGLTGSVRVEAWKYQPLTGYLYVGVATIIDATIASQTARYTFYGSTGERLRLTLSNASSTTKAFSVFADVYSPTGAYITGTYIDVGKSARFVDIPNLLEEGEYKVVFQAGHGHKFRVQARLDPR